MAAEMEVMEPSSSIVSKCFPSYNADVPLVHEPKLLVLVEYLEKSSIFSAELHAA